MKKELVTISRREFLIRTTKASVGVGAGFSLGLYLTACNDGPADAVDTNGGAAKASSPEENPLRSMPGLWLSPTILSLFALRAPRWDRAP